MKESYRGEVERQQLTFWLVARNIEDVTTFFLDGLTLPTMLKPVDDNDWCSILKENNICEFRIWEGKYGKCEKRKTGKAPTPATTWSHMVAALGKT
jgi:hypothetical protein